MVSGVQYKYLSFQVVCQLLGHCTPVSLLSKYSMKHSYRRKTPTQLPEHGIGQRNRPAKFNQVSAY
jgi:hypothetical protein